MSLSEILKGVIGESHANEKYEGVSISDVIDMVDIEVGFGMDAKGDRTTLLVVEGNCAETWEYKVPNVSSVEMTGERYMIRYTKSHDFRFMDEGEVKEMRARFLLLNKAYYRRLNSMSHSMRGEVVAKFFGGSAWTPEEGSVLAKAMGTASNL